MLARVPTRYPDILHRFNGKDKGKDKGAPKWALTARTRTGLSAELVRN